MSQKSKTIVFFGSGPVAAKSLEKLLNWANIEMVITKNRPHHHKDPAPVETIAKKHQLKLGFADNKKQLDDLILSAKPTSTIGVVIDYGVIISQATIDYFPLGIINSHFSLLPEWRGADPITYSLLSGQKITGVSLMTIDQGMDTGPVLSTAELSIDESWDNQQLTNQLVYTSDKLLQKTLPAYLEGKILPVSQAQNTVITYSRMLNKQDGVLDFDKPASVLAREIRAFSKWPSSVLTLPNGFKLTIIKATTAQEKLNVGQIQIKDKKLLIGCQVGSLEILKVKPAGKKEMDVRSFLNGYAHLFKDS